MSETPRSQRREERRQETEWKSRGQQKKGNVSFFSHNFSNLSRRSSGQKLLFVLRNIILPWLNSPPAPFDLEYQRSQRSGRCETDLDLRRRDCSATAAGWKVEDEEEGGGGGRKCAASDQMWPEQRLNYSACRSRTCHFTFPPRPPV